MRAIFIADAHLRHPADENYRRLITFLDAQAGQLDGLFLLGDIFEFWLGYRHVVFSQYLPLLEKLRVLHDAGCQLYYVEGNHDFNLGPYFSETLGCRVIPDEAVIDWDNQKLWLCHGDLINKELKGYRLLRAFWRSLPVRFLSRVVHPDPVWSFGTWLSDKSGKYQTHSPDYDPLPQVLPYARQCLEKSDIFICGHFHHPTLQQLEEGRAAILGDIIEQYSYAELVDGELSLKTF